METSKQPEALRLAEHFSDLGLFAIGEQAAAELRRQHAEIERLQAERDALNAALRRLYVAAPIGLKCSDFHHSKREQHSAMSKCSQVTEYLAALEKARAAISTATGAAA